MNDADPLAALAERLRARDPAALAEYFDRRRHRLLAYIGGRMGSALWARTEPEEILQETLIAAWKYLPDAPLENRDPFGWLCDVADQRIVDAARKARAQKRDVRAEAHLSSFGGIPADHSTPSMAATRNEQQAALDEALSKLPPLLQEVMHLRYRENLPTKDIARRVNKSDDSIRVMLSHTVRTLKATLGCDLPEPG